MLSAYLKKVNGNRYIFIRIFALSLILFALLQNMCYHYFGDLMKLNKAYVQEVADAISAILNIDVTIVDDNLLRVAATGIYKTLVGEQLPRGCSYENILSSKEPNSIVERNLDHKCENCSHVNNCFEISNIGYPIISKTGEVLGVIGLIAFNKEQKKYIDSNYSSINLFLNKLSSLLAGNLIYENTIKSLSLKNQEIENIINSLNNGIALTDENLKIQLYNQRFLEFTRLRKDTLDSKSMNDVFNNFEFNKNKDKLITSLNPKLNASEEQFIIQKKENSLNLDVKSYIFQINKYSYEVINAYNTLDKKGAVSFDSLSGKNISIRNAITLSKQVSKSDITILINGETGTGKESFARAIHNYSNNDSNFISVDLNSIPENSMEMDLYGYETIEVNGSLQSKIGKFELASGGTLFIKEIGKLPLHLQPKILDTINSKKYKRLGCDKNLNFNCRIIASSTLDLSDLVEKGLFIKDLFNLINIVPINLPPLRERVDDIESLSTELIDKYCILLNKPKMRLSSDLLDIFKNYKWTGNIRELENITEYLVNISKDKIIGPNLLPNFFDNVNFNDFNKENSVNIDFKKNNSLKDLTENFEKYILLKYIDKYGDSTKSKKKISELLEINLSTLYRKLYRYGIC